MKQERVLVVGLDGWDHAYAQRLQQSGDLPTLSALKERSARFLLDPQGRQLDGLDWERFVSGLGSETTHRYSSLNFDKTDYSTWQEVASFPIFVDRIKTPAVVFDLPYCDFEGTSHVHGVSGWGTESPGLATPRAKPATLLPQLVTRFGTYPSRWLGGVVPRSVAQAKAMGAGLVQGVQVRRQVASWILGQAIPDWELAIVIAAETHSATEAFWHGVDATHPLHGDPSADESAAALRRVYQETDRMIGGLLDEFHPGKLLVFALNGMANNRFDVPSMCLLPELLFRSSLGKTKLKVPIGWSEAPGEVPILAADGPSWDGSSASWFGECQGSAGGPRSAAAGIRRRLGAALSRLGRQEGQTLPGREDRISVDWHPASRYQEYWPRMKAFALPSYSVGRIRINLRGREREGMVDPSEYDQVCNEISHLVRACRDPRSGQPAAESVSRCSSPDPLSYEGTRADITVLWREGVCALEHDTLGLVGPLPYRRVADHTGRYGFAYLAGPHVVPGDRGVHSELDLPATIVQLVGAAPLAGLSGNGLLQDGEITRARD